MGIVTDFKRRILGRRVGTLAAGILAFSLVADAANVSAAQAAARSTWVTLVNQTGCDLTLTGDYGLDHGEWTREPPAAPGYIRAGSWASWGSESNGFLTGTEGHAQFATSECRPLSHRVITIHWDNPYIGANSYDYGGTDPAFWVPHSGGSGNNANVTFYARR